MGLPEYVVSKMARYARGQSTDGSACHRKRDLSSGCIRGSEDGGRLVSRTMNRVQSEYAFYVNRKRQQASGHLWVLANGPEGTCTLLIPVRRYRNPGMHPNEMSKLEH
jgi:hypothetical protein